MVIKGCNLAKIARMKDKTLNMGIITEFSAFLKSLSSSFLKVPFPFLPYRELSIFGLRYFL